MVDVMPTVLDLAGVDRNGLLMQGDSFVPLIEARDPNTWAGRIVVSEKPTALGTHHRVAPCLCGSVTHEQVTMDPETVK